VFYTDYKFNAGQEKTVPFAERKNTHSNRISVIECDNYLV